MEKNQIRTIDENDIRLFFQQLKDLYGNRLYLKNKIINQNIDLILVLEHPNDDPISNKVYNRRYDKLLKKIIKSIDMKINYDTLIFTVLTEYPGVQRAPLTEEIRDFRNRLSLSIKSFKPKIILGFGKYVGKSLINRKISFKNMRNEEQAFDGVPVKITHDPLSILNDSDLKKPLWTDLKYIRDYLKIGESE